MANKQTAVFGIYQNPNQAERVVARLLEEGFSNDNISILLQNRQGRRDFAQERNAKATEGATTGITAGGVIGGTLGLLAGIGALAIPGVGPFLAAGPIMGALAGVGAGAAAGGLIGALAGMGIPECEAKRYEGHIQAGGALLSVHCETSDEITLAKVLLKHMGARDILSSSDVSADYPAASKTAAYTGG